MSDRSADWIAQAECDLAAAKAQFTAGFHEWACFISQQAGETAAKAVLQRWGAEAWGLSVVRLLEAVGERAELPAEIRTAAQVLDRYYVPARYPNGFAEGKPADYIGERDAADATGSAESIIRICNRLLAE